MSTVTPNSIKKWTEPIQLPSHRKNSQSIQQILRSSLGKQKFPHIPLPKWHRLANRTYQGVTRHRPTLAQQYPLFVQEYLQQTIKPPKKPQFIKRIPLYQPTRKKIIIQKKQRKSFEPPPVKDLNELTVRTIRSCSVQRRSQKKNGFYKPYVIEISPRSRMTLYSKQPLKVSKEIKLGEIKKENSPFRISSPPSPDDVEDEDQKILESPIHVEEPAMTFVEKVNRAKVILDSTQRLVFNQ